MDQKKLGILLSTPPSHPSVDTTVHLSEEGLRSNVDLYIYLIDEGVKNLHDPRFVAASNRGAKVFVCAYGCQKHGVSTEGISPNMTLCGLVILSNIVNGCDRFLAFN